MKYSTFVYFHFKIQTFSYTLYCYYLIHILIQKAICKLIKSQISNLVCMARFLLTRRESLVEQELPTLPEHPSSPGLVGFVLLDLQFYKYVLLIVVCPFVLFLLAIVLSILLRCTDSDCPFGIFKLFFWTYISRPSILTLLFLSVLNIIM